ncbi:hypothetical protein [Gymnodinialimonas sp.]
MRHFLLALGLALFAPTLAAACPTITAGATQLTLSEAQLANPYTINTGASGNIDLANCGHIGFVNAAPQVSINFTETYGPVQVSTYSSCDTVLLVNAPDGSWWFNDDSGGSTLSWMMVDVNPGRMDVWVGTYNGSTCDAQVTLN